MSDIFSSVLITWNIWGPGEGDGDRNQTSGLGWIKWHFSSFVPKGSRALGTRSRMPVCLPFNWSILAWTGGGKSTYNICNGIGAKRREPLAKDEGGVYGNWEAWTGSCPSLIINNIETTSTLNRIFKREFKLGFKWQCSYLAAICFQNTVTPL